MNVGFGPEWIAPDRCGAKDRSHLQERTSSDRRHRLLLQMQLANRDLYIARPRISCTSWSVKNFQQASQRILNVSTVLRTSQHSGNYAGPQREAGHSVKGRYATFNPRTSRYFACAACPISSASSLWGKSKP